MGDYHSNFNNSKALLASSDALIVSLWTSWRWSCGAVHNKATQVLDPQQWLDVLQLHPLLWQPPGPWHASTPVSINKMAANKASAIIIDAFMVILEFLSVERL